MQQSAAAVHTNTTPDTGTYRSVKGTPGQPIALSSVTWGLGFSMVRSVVEMWIPTPVHPVCSARCVPVRPPSGVAFEYTHPAPPELYSICIRHISVTFSFS